MRETGLILKFWSYFRDVQPPLVRVLHLVVLVLVLMQLISSNLIRFDSLGRVSDAVAFFLGSWTHFIIGIALAVIGLVFVVIEFFRHGVRHFFPYLWGNLTQIKADLKTLRNRHLPEAVPGSLATAVQGLGLVTLILTLASGLGWFLLWQAGGGMAGIAISIHEVLTSLMQAYVIGHGGLGLLHIILRGRAKGRA